MNITKRKCVLRASKGILGKKKKRGCIGKERQIENGTKIGT